MREPINGGSGLSRSVPIEHYVETPAFPTDVATLERPRNVPHAQKPDSRGLGAQGSSPPPPKTVQFDLPSSGSSSRASTWSRDADGDDDDHSLERGYESGDSDTTIEDDPYSG